MDEDGYPTEEELDKIKNWPYRDYKALMAYIRERWAYAEDGYWQQKQGIYYISTAGWSGNEEIIQALKENHVFWGICWESTHSGGHYEFILSKRKQDEDTKAV